MDGFFQDTSFYREVYSVLLCLFPLFTYTHVTFSVKIVDVRDVLLHIIVIAAFKI